MQASMRMKFDNDEADGLTNNWFAVHAASGIARCALRNV